MATEIGNNGASLKIVTDGVPRFILKNQIREVEIVRDTIIKIDLGLGALNNIYVDQLEVTAPVSAGVEDLRDQIIAMFQTSLDGVATEANQKKEIEIISGFAVGLKEMGAKVNSLEDKTFYDPSLVDESNPNVVYNGFAAPGAKTSDPVWAVQKVTKVKGVFTYQWAAGTKAFDKIWDERTKLLFS